MQKYFALMIPGENATKREARRLGFTFDLMGSQALDDSRHAGHFSGQGWTAYLARLVNQASGLDRTTRSMKLAVAMESLTRIGDGLSTNTTFGNLSPNFKRALADADITADDWNFMRKHKDTMHDFDGVSAFSTMEFRAKRHTNVRDIARAAKLADKLDNWIEKLQQMTTNETTLLTQAVTSGAFLAPDSAGKGSLLRSGASSFFLFKTFPITVMNTHIAASMGNIIKTRGSDFTAIEHLANTILLTTIFGAGAIQAKQMARGKSPQDWQSMQFGVAAFMQGGGLGLAGDFLFSDSSRFGRNALTDLAGPMAGLASDIQKTFVGKPLHQRLIEGKKPNHALDMFRLAKRNIPLGSLWYTRLVLERLILDQVERWLDPKYDQRMRRVQRQIRKEKGQRFYWDPGVSPLRSR
jgi:hypothetical protein